MKIAIHTPTESEFNELIKHFDSKSITCRFIPLFTIYSNQTCFRYNDSEYWFSPKSYYMGEGYSIIPFSDQKANNFKIEIQL
jgi:hypothetical protein